MPRERKSLAAEQLANSLVAVSAIFVKAEARSHVSGIRVPSPQAVQAETWISVKNQH